MKRPKKLNPEKALTRPSKGFFVNMLTRDINLYDAILDLIDNSLDGVRRMGKKENLSGHFVEITFDGDHFRMKDNCGGIPLNVAKESAFALGRPEGVKENEKGMVGIYGIGMKRAIFKLGRDAVIRSRSYKTEKLKKRYDFQVRITEAWLNDPEWSELDINKIETGTETGTTITVKKLNEATSNILATKSATTELRKRISRHFALILDKGFRISVVGPGTSKNKGNLKSTGEFFELLQSKGKDALKPFIATGIIGNVKFEIYAGFTSNPALSQDDVSDTETRADKVKSGWTVACNDRIILWRDRTILTSWGANSVGMHHSQYNSIVGLVLLTGATDELPLTTTKAGVDMSNALYLQILQIMAAATRELASFTSKVKKDRVGYSALIEKAAPLSIKSLRKIAKAVSGDEDLTNTIPGLPNAHSQPIEVPNIPKPKKSSRQRISYTVDPHEFLTVAKYLKVKTPKTVGEKTFQIALEAAEFNE